MPLQSLARRKSKKTMNAMRIIFMVNSLFSAISKQVTYLTDFISFSVLFLDWINV